MLTLISRSSARFWRWTIFTSCPRSALTQANGKAEASMERTHRLRERRLLRRWPIVWAVIACLAAAIIGSTSLSQFASGLVHGNQPPRTTALPSFPLVHPPKAVCGDGQQLAGPSSPPAAAVVVPAGSDAEVNFSEPDTTYWF